MIAFVSLKCIFCHENLEVKRINSDIVYGIYHFTEQEGIIFNSTTTRVTITDLQGEQLLLVSDRTEKQRWVAIHTDLFIQHETRGGYRDYYVPHSLQKEMKNRQANQTDFSFLDSLPPSFHYNKLKKSFEAFILKPTTHYIIQSAFKLGRDLNYMGMEYPSILPFYFIAHTLKEVFAKISASKNQTKCTHISKYNDVTDDDSCFEECPPCPEQECLSLCGYGCHCWKWICGDCCYHLGCHGHDLCCRERFIQTKCLFPISFKCDSEYYC